AIQSPATSALEYLDHPLSRVTTLPGADGSAARFAAVGVSTIRPAGFSVACNFRRGFPWRSEMTPLAESPRSAPRQQGRQVFSSLLDRDADHRVGSQNCERPGK